MPRVESRPRGRSFYVVFFSPRDLNTWIRKGRDLRERRSRARAWTRARKQRLDDVIHPENRFVTSQRGRFPAVAHFPRHDRDWETKTT